MNNLQSKNLQCPTSKLILTHYAQCFLNTSKVFRKTTHENSKTRQLDAGWVFCWGTRSMSCLLVPIRILDSFEYGFPESYRFFNPNWTGVLRCQSWTAGGGQFGLPTVSQSWSFWEIGTKHDFWFLCSENFFEIFNFSVAPNLMIVETTRPHYLQLKLLSGKNARTWDSMDFT